MVRGETTDALPVTVWSPEGTIARDPLPLLLVQDGPEYDVLASLSRYSGALIAAGRLPPHRLALLEPVQRNALVLRLPAVPAHRRWVRDSPG